MKKRKIILLLTMAMMLIVFIWCIVNYPLYSTVWCDFGFISLEKAALNNINDVHVITAQMIKDTHKAPSTSQELIEYNPIVSKFMYSPLNYNDSGRELFKFYSIDDSNTTIPIIYYSHAYKHNHNCYMVCLPNNIKILVPEESLDTFLKSYTLPLMRDKDDQGQLQMEVD